MISSELQHALRALEKAAKFGINASLDHMVQLADAMGNPQTKWIPIHLTGTNGKTSTARLIEALLRAHGASTGLSTSPHLLTVNERIVINGLPIKDERLAESLNAAFVAASRITADCELDRECDLTQLGTPITEFEYLSAATFHAFTEHDVDFGVVESGIGGLWDATCIIDPSVAVVTSVGLDHTALLGDSLEAIAFDKSHIIKAGSTAVLGDGLDEQANLYPIFLKRAEAVGANCRAVRRADKASPVIEELTTRYDVRQVQWGPDFSVVTTCAVRTPLCDYGTISVPAPPYQAINIATAITAVEAAMGRALDKEKTADCLAAMSYPGRFEVISRDPLILFDGAHNPQATELLVELLSSSSIRPVIAIGGFRDKDFTQMVKLLSEVTEGFIVVEPPSARALRVKEMADIIHHSGGAPLIGACTEVSLNRLTELSGKHPLVITGSLSLYSLIKSSLKDSIN